MSSLDDLRRRINELDRQILELVGKRQETSREVARAKRATGHATRDYNRERERVDPSAVIARVVAVEVPGLKKGMERVVAIETDILALFYRASFALSRLFGPLLPKPVSPGSRIGPIGRVGRATFAAMERFISFFLPERR